LRLYKKETTLPTKVTIPELQARKGNAKFTMLTAYDAPFARLVDEAGIDVILVGDSLGMVMLGYSGTAPVTMDEMIHHAKAVGRTAKRALLVGDMPFMAYQLHDPAEAVRNAARHIKEASMDCVKLEATAKHAPLVRAIVDAGIAVVAHIGLTPQTAASLGGMTVQGANLEQARALVADALALEEAGAWAILLEAVPAALAARITARLRVPTIGIGAGLDCDGQVLVTHEMLGLFPGFGLPFGKRYTEAGTLISQGMRQYAADVMNGTFPEAANSFAIGQDVLDALDPA
jgi:3-methyl-2-oxobutanoate hydroxymethyltransferase